MIKRIIKIFFGYLGWKLIKINRRKPTGYPYGEPQFENLKCIMKSKGILHLGAHRGSEAAVYEWFNKKVVWVEAIPKIFNELKDNIKFIYNQRAVCALLGDKDQEGKKFHISNNDGACSSVFNFSNEVKTDKLWSDRSKNDFEMIQALNLNMKKLDTVFLENKIDPKEYDYWVMDLQGAELIVLKGAENILKHCNFIFTEISKVEYYEGGCLWPELLKHLTSKGFQVVNMPSKNHDDVLFVRKYKDLS